jgi:hypothetical protein
MTVASEISLPKWQKAPAICQNGRHSKYRAKLPANMAKRFFVFGMKLFLDFSLAMPDNYGMLRASPTER